MTKPADSEQNQVPPKKRRGLSIGAKFLSLILLTLFLAVGVIVYNATNLFQKDNLNNIYVASDMLTAAKAGEVSAWLGAIVQKGTVIGKILLTQEPKKPGLPTSLPTLGQKPSEKSDVEEDIRLKTFGSDSDLLLVSLFHSRNPEGGRGFLPKEFWLNKALSEKSKLDLTFLDELRDRDSDSFQQVSLGSIFISSHVVGDGQAVLILNVPLVQNTQGQFNIFANIIVKQEKLLESFADTGAYSLALISGKGIVLAHPEVERVKSRENLSDLPIVKKMLESSLDREFQEFEVNKERFLGAYAKVGMAGLGVISQIPRERAFEAGRVLVRRSVLIAILVLSIAFIGSYLFAQTIVSPIRLLSQAAQRIAHGNFDINVTVKTRDEISELASSFNIMSSEIGRKIENLSHINESSKEISSTMEAKKLLSLTLKTLVELLGTSGGIIFSVSENPETIDPNQGEKVNWSDELTAAIPGIYQKELLDLKEPEVIDLGGKKVLASPLDTKTKRVGFVLLVDKKDQRGFTEEDGFVLGTILTSVAITFENIDLLEKTADGARMEKELETAKHVQDTMFPPTEISMPGLDIFSYYVPASECGGDWWGLFPINEDEVVIAIGDATGHGVPAAMVTATAKATCSVLEMFTKFSEDVVRSPANVLGFLNKAVFEATAGQILMTFFVATINTKNGEVTYASASHDPIYWYKIPEGELEPKGSKENLGAMVCEQGPRLGQQAGSTYVDAKMVLSANDFIVLYTDGLPEGKCPGAGEEYTERKYMRSIVKHAHKTMKEVREGILADFNKFVQDEPLHDDVTLAVCQFKGRVS